MSATTNNAGGDAATDVAGVDDELAQAREEQRHEADGMLGMGVGIGAIGAVSAVAFGSVCTLCVVAAPALVGVGLYKRFALRRSRRDEP